MINLLIDLIKARLQSDLEMVPEAQWYGFPLEQVKTPTLPCVAIYGGEITFLPTHQDRQLAQDCREFQQALWIDVAGDSSAQVEQLISLIVGLISLNQQSWLVDCNQLSEDSAHHYASSTITTRHRFRQIKIISASPHYDEKKVKLQIQCLAVGQLEITNLSPDQTFKLKTVVATGTLGRVQDKRIQADKSTEWITKEDSDS